MSLDPVTGPLSREEFARAIDAPFGGAAEIIRAHDPLWGIATGEKIKWRVQFRRRVWEEGYTTVEAATKEEAEKLAAEIPASNIDWEICDFNDEGEIESVEPQVRR